MTGTEFENGVNNILDSTPSKGVAGSGGITKAIFKQIVVFFRQLLDSLNQNGLYWKSEFVLGTQYFKGNVVLKNGNIYRAKIDNVGVDVSLANTWEAIFVGNTHQQIFFCEQLVTSDNTFNIYKNAVIVVNENSKINPGGYFNVFKIANNVTEVELRISKLIEVAGVDACLPILQDANGESILMESGDNYLTEVFPDYPILRFSGKSLFFRRNVDGWAFYVEEEDFKNNNFNRLSGTALFTGSANSSFSLTPSGVISDKTYIIINAKNGSYTVAVTFNSNPQNYSSAVITIKNKATAVTAATPQLEFSGSMRFMYSSLLSKFVILG